MNTQEVSGRALVPSRIARIVGIVMVCASLTAWYLTPTKNWSTHVAAIKYETLFPQRFGADWVLADEQATSVVNPQQQETLDTIYDQIVSRVYVHVPSGRRLMISLAYGSNQSRATQIHKPEVCYPAQGFDILSMRKDNLELKSTAVPVMRIVAKMGRRIEPLTYWVRSGDRVVRGAIEQNLARVALGLRGYIPDGLLFRISELTPDDAASFALQDQFVRDFLAQMPEAARESFIGTAKGSV